MSKHIQPISHYPQTERMKTFLIKTKTGKKNIETHSDLTEGSAGFTHLETVPKNDHISGAIAA